MVIKPIKETKPDGFDRDYVIHSSMGVSDININHSLTWTSEGNKSKDFEEHVTIQYDIDGRSVNVSYHLKGDESSIEYNGHRSKGLDQVAITLLSENVPTVLSTIGTVVRSEHQKLGLFLR